jgi:hypothetical protein
MSHCKELISQYFLYLTVLSVLLIGVIGCEGLGTAIYESVKDSKTDFNNDYGTGASRSLSRGTDGITTADPYRIRINNLFEENKISKTERNRRLNSLFSAYDTYKAGRMSKSAFKNHAEALAEE